MRDQNNIVDWTLGEKLANGNRALAKELFDMLLETLPQHKQEIQTAYDKKNFTQLAQAVHKLHGATCYVGTVRLKQATEDLEHAAKQNQTDQIDIFYKKFCKELELVMNYQ
ncbi:MAG: Hpt domain-containing protein [Pseudomonadota bacterium]